MRTITTYRKVGAFYIACNGDFTSTMNGERLKKYSCQGVYFGCEVHPTGCFCKYEERSSSLYFVKRWAFVPT